MSKLLTFLAAFVASGCAGTASTSVDTRAGYFADPVDFIGVNFKTGRPASENDLMASLADQRSKDALQHDLSLISAFPASEPLRIEGYTDSHECSGTICIALSQRRAQVMHNWLIKQGVPASRLSQPYGYGAARPIGDNGTAPGRASNRRAYISYGWR